MKYESNVLKRLIDTYGVVGNPRYISEIIKEFIVQGKERYPDLFTYQSDWLAHIDEFGLNPTYTVSYTGQSIYAPNTLEKPVKSASLKGSTKYHDIETGEILEVFEEGRNLELVSVKIPVLTTINGSAKILTDTHLTATGELSPHHNSNKAIEDYILIPPMDVIVSNVSWLYICFYDENKNFISDAGGNDINKFELNDTTIPDNAKYFRFHYHSANLPLIRFVNGTDYIKATIGGEPFKTNILTVNEDVTLSSNGDICDELNLLTGQLTQRIGEDGEILTQEVVKTVDLTILDQNGQNVKQLITFNGGTHFITGSSEGLPLPTVSVSVETDLEETLKVCSLEGNTL